MLEGERVTRLTDVCVCECVHAKLTGSQVFLSSCPRIEPAESVKYGVYHLQPFSLADLSRKNAGRVGLITL